MAALAKLFVEVGANVNHFERGMKQVRSDIDRTANHASLFSNSLSTAIGYGVANAVNSMTQLGKSIISTGINFNALEQNSTTAFETMLGSVDKAKAFLDDLKQFAKTTPFELPGLIEASQRLLAFGFQANKIVPMMTNIGDAVAGLGGSPEKLNRVILAFGQIKAKGRVMAGEMLQLTEAGIPAWDMLAKKIGVSIPEAMKLGEKGLIDSDTAITAILEGMSLKFGGLMSKQSKGWTGMLSNIKDTFTQVTGRVMKPFFELGLKGMDKLLQLFNSPVFDVFVTRMESGAKIVANFIGKIGKGLIGLFSGDYRSFFGNLFGGFDKLNSILSKYENKRFGWLSNFTPKEALTAINGFITDLKNGGKNLDYWITHTPKLLQPLEKLAISGMKVWKYLAGEGIQITLKKLGSILTGLGSTLGKLVRPFKDALGSLFTQLSTMKNLGFADIFKAVLSSIGQAFFGFLKVIQTEFWPTIKSSIVWVWNALSSFVSTIDWSGIWQGIVTGFQNLVGFVQGIDWAGLWSNIWSGLNVIGQFLVDSVLPALTGFFDWLLSWFLDAEKRNRLYTAISSTWSFITEWASYIWSSVQPHLSAFFNWLSSWFTDPAKKQQLWNGIVSAWNFVSEWAIGLWQSINPVLANFFNSISSWFTEPSKKQTLWNGIVNTWNFLTEWAKSIWNWISPYLASVWSSLTSWVTDPSKRQLLWNGIVSTWNVFTIWGSNLWGWLSPHLTTLGTNLKTWIDTNAPNLGSWVDSFSSTSTKIKDDWLAKWPVISEAFKNFAEIIKIEVPLIIQALSNMFKAIPGDNDGLGGYFAKVIAFYTNYFSFLIKTTRIVTEMLDAMVETTQKAFNFDWNGYVSGSLKFGSKISELVSHLSTLPQLGQGYATGGITQGGRVLVGEKGPELIDLPGGSRVWDHGQSMGKLSGTSSRIEIVITNNGKLDIDRKTIDEIAMQLQRKLNMQGNRFVLAT